MKFSYFFSVIAVAGIFCSSALYGQQEFSSSSDAAAVVEEAPVGGYVPPVAVPEEALPTAPVAPAVAKQQVHATGHGDEEASSESLFPTPLEQYAPLEEAQEKKLGRPLTILEILSLRVSHDPLNVIVSFIFLLAIIHTFLCSSFNRLAAVCEKKHREYLSSLQKEFPKGKEPVSFRATLFHFLGEVEVVFGIWIIPLFAVITLAPSHGWSDAVAYMNSRHFGEPLFVVVIMTIAASRPIISFAMNGMRFLAKLGNSQPWAWWTTILIVGPLLGSFVTEPAAMTISAMLLAQQFYRYRPSMILCYATLGLLFVNVSVGGTLTNFSAPPILMIASPWKWDALFMLQSFGWRAALGIAVSTALYLLFFHKELFSIGKNEISQASESSASSDAHIPAWVTIAHIAFLAFTVLTVHDTPFVIIGFMFFLAFIQATRHFQYQLSIRPAILVGFFLAGLIIHGGLQAWWIAPILSNLTEHALFTCATILTAFNDNAAITYLASQVPAFNHMTTIDGAEVLKTGTELLRSQALQYAVVAGAVTGGGLTVIANAPNPAGMSLLSKYFGEDGVSAVRLFLAALIPTLIMAVCFMVLP